MNTQDKCAHIFFMDGTDLVVRYPTQGAGDPATVASNVRRAIEQDKLVVEADGSLFMIPVRNIKYIQITPAPEALPRDVIRGGHIEISLASFASTDAGAF